MTESTPIDPISSRAPTAWQKEIIRLLIIPLLVYCAWIAEIYLLGGATALFLAPDILPLLLYTVIGCILTGMIVVVVILRRSFQTRAVTLLQIGFRSAKRTLTACTLTLAACSLAAVLYGMGSTPRAALPALFCLYLPTGIAAVMVCWVLVGTHLQALLRSGGPALSIPVSVVITAILFALTARVHTPVMDLSGFLATAILLGLVIALFFFAVRDVYATSIVVTFGMAQLFSGRVDPSALDRVFPGVVFIACLALFALLAIHGWFFRSYTTVLVAPDTKTP